MQKTEKIPLWVFLALSSIETRRGALWLICSSVVFTVYCVPWVMYFKDQAWVVELFLIEDWEWFAMMLPMTAWYWLSMRWVDKNGGWNTAKI